MMIKFLIPFQEIAPFKACECSCLAFLIFVFSIFPFNSNFILKFYCLVLQFEQKGFIEYILEQIELDAGSYPLQNDQRRDC